MPLHVIWEDVLERKRLQPGGGQGKMGVKKVYGNELSLMIAVREPGYHSKPHCHESDQIIYVLKGENWWFIENQGFHCKEGDFLRIPGNKTQWDWNRSDADSKVVEAHAPPMIGGPSGEGAVGLFNDGEVVHIKSTAVNKYVAHDSDSVEKRYKL